MILPALEFMIEKAREFSQKDWPNIRFCELGDQIMKRNGRRYVHKNIILEKGALEHVSIDWNGKRGSVPLDLRSEVEDFREYFDIVTNYGTLEHVDNQYYGWKNFHNFARVGGIMVHAIPPIGDWPRHCDYRYSKNFFVVLSRLNNYSILYEDTIFCEDERKSKSRHMYCAILRKNTPNFTSLEGFENINQEIEYAPGT